MDDAFHSIAVLDAAYTSLARGGARLPVPTDLGVLRPGPGPALGLLLDTGNYVDGLVSIRRTAHLARHVHAKFRRVGVDGRDGVVDHAAVIGELRRVGYDGCLSVEYEGEEPGHRAVPRALSHLRELLEA